MVIAGKVALTGMRVKTPQRFYCASEGTGASENKVADSEDEMAKGERAGKRECDPVLSISGIKDECGTWKDGHTKDYWHGDNAKVISDPANVVHGDADTGRDGHRAQTYAFRIPAPQEAKGCEHCDLQN